jgi:hypothetical protein
MLPTWPRVSAAVATNVPAVVRSRARWLRPCATFSSSFAADLPYNSLHTIRLRTIRIMDIALAKQLASFVGALLILVAYGHQMGWMNSRSTLYNILNAVGSGILGYIALHPFQIGFVVLESVWTLISLYALARPRKVTDC